LGADHAERLLDLMSELKPPEHDMGFYSEPMRLMIFDCWIALGGDRALPAMQDRLGQSWAGHALRAMIVHEEERRRAWQAHEARSDPVKDHERRLRRDRERQLAQERRILQKMGRDKRFWANAHNDLEKNGYNPTPAAPPPSAYQQQTSHSPPSPPPQTWPLGIQPNRFAGFCYCCGLEVGWNAGVIFKPIVHNANAPGDWKYACPPCNGSAHVGTNAAQRQRGAKRRPSVKENK
jgi:hypothetical protein